MQNILIVLLNFFFLSHFCNCSTWINCTSECKECRESSPSVCLSCFADKGHSFSQNLCIEKQKLILEDYIYNTNGFIRISRDNNYFQAIDSGSKVGFSLLPADPQQSWWKIQLQSSATGYVKLQNWLYNNLYIGTDLLLIQSERPNTFQIQIQGASEYQGQCLTELLQGKSCSNKVETEWLFEYFDEPVKISYVQSSKESLIFRIEHFSKYVKWKLEDENTNECKLLELDGNKVVGFQGGVLVNYTMTEIASFCSKSLSTNFVFQISEESVIRTIFKVELNNEKEIQKVEITDLAAKKTIHYSSDLVKFNITSRDIQGSEVLFSVLLPVAATPKALPSKATLIQKNLTYEQQLILKKKESFENTNQIQLELLIECSGISIEGLYDVIISLPIEISSTECYLDVFERINLLAIEKKNGSIFDDSTINDKDNKSTTLIIIFAVVLGTLIPSIAVISIYAYKKNIWCCKDRSVQYYIIFFNSSQVYYKEKQSQEQVLREKLKAEQEKKNIYAGGAQFGRHQIERKNSQEEFEIALREIKKQEEQEKNQDKKKAGDDDFDQFHLELE